MTCLLSANIVKETTGRRRIVYKKCVDFSFESTQDQPLSTTHLINSQVNMAASSSSARAQRSKWTVITVQFNHSKMYSYDGTSAYS